MEQRHLNSLLDDEGTGLEPLVELLHHLSDELVVVQLFSALHNPEKNNPKQSKRKDKAPGNLPNDAGLYLVLPVLVHLLPGLVPLRFGLALPGAGLQ